MLNKGLPSLESIHTVALDFDGVFTDNTVWVDQEGCEMVCCNRSDGLAFDLVRVFKDKGKLKANFFILSKEGNPVVLRRAKKLKLDCHHGIHDKLAFMRGYLVERFPTAKNPFSGLIYLGNDLNDLPLMRHAGYVVVPSDAHPKVKEIAHLVLEQRGGAGFVRAFIESLLGVEQLSKEEIDELVSHC